MGGDGVKIVGVVEVDGGGGGGSDGVGDGLRLAGIGDELDEERVGGGGGEA